jgi:mRNA-degrading endonuclease toxin of MazEF toxin-antitoxin module
VASISPGTILWVRLGPRGNYEERPVVAISSPDSDGNLYIVGGSTKHARDPEREIELPSAPTRHPLTNLKKTTFVDAGWIVKIHVNDILQTKGRVPATILVDIQDRIRKIFPDLV